MHCQCFQQLEILFKPWTKFARLFFFSCQWHLSIRYRQGMTWLSFSLFYYTDVMNFIPLTMRTKLTDLTQLFYKNLQHLLFFCFSVLIFQLHFGFVLEFHCPKLLDSFLSIDLVWLAPLSLNFILTFIYMSPTVRERGSRWYNDSMLGTSSDKLITKMHVPKIKNDQAVLTLYRERWLK